MFNLFAVFITILTAKEVAMEKLERPAPEGTHFNWDAYWKDVESGVSTIEQLKKRQRGDYDTTKPFVKETIPINDVLDIDRYNHDKKVYGECIAEVWRKQGSYKIKRRL